MRLGILVKTDRHLDKLEGIALAALGQGHEVEVFVMDGGVKLLGEPSVAELSTREGASVAFCGYNAMLHEISTDGLSDTIASGSQYNNVCMMRNLDRMIVL